MPDLVVDDVTVEYSSGGYKVRPLDGMTFTVPDGALALLIGPSGCGKTTMLSCLAGILSPAAGSIRLGDLEVTTLKGDALTEYRRHTVGIVFQAFNLVASLTAAENVMASMRAARVGRAEAKRRAVELLTRVGLEDRMKHRPDGLSGGQQQRVAIARALALQPKLLLADEPTADLDYVQVEGVLQILRGLAAPGRVVVVVTHDDRLLPLADLVVEMVPKVAAVNRRSEQESYDAGRVIFRQGDMGDRIYVIESGEVDILRERDDGGQELVIALGPGVFFGEIGAMFGIPRSATAQARTATTVTTYSVREFREQWPRLQGNGKPPAPDPPEAEPIPTGPRVRRRRT